MDALRSPAPREARASRRIGEVVGKYQLREILGVGGMSTVYGATHRNGLAVAIKVLHDELAGDESVRRWFLREAYLANRVNHRGAVRILDDDTTADGAAYLVIERLYGRTLRALCESTGRKLPPQAVALFAYDVLDVLAAAHTRGIIHRDVKPENLFLTDDGELKVLDFGIAHPLPIVGESSATTIRVAGTPAFMAPEQARGVLVRAETDVWGVGATMFALATGEHVHVGVAPPDLLAWAGTQPARSIRTVAHDLPMALAEVIDRALAFDAEHRFPTAHAMREALAEAFAATFGASLPDARPDVLKDLRARSPALARVAPRGEVHSIATQAPPASDASELRGAVTRTKTIALPPEGAAPGRRRFAVGVFALGFAAATLVASGLVLRARSKGAARRSQPAVATPGSPAAPYEAKALEAFRMGLALWHAASPNDALGQFVQAADTDPSFAPAHLYVALLTPFVRTTTRSHYAQALKFKDALNPFQVAVAEAIEPGMADHPDWSAAVARLTDLRARFPDETELPLLVAHRLRLLLDPERALHAVAASDPAIPVVWSLRANAYAQLDKEEDARAALEQCLALAPASTSCSQMLLQFESESGHCERTENLARQVIARSPDSPIGYEFLAGALFATTRSVDATAAVLEQRRARLTAIARDRAEWRDGFALAVLSGDAGRAAHVLDVAEAKVGASPDSSAHGEIAYDRMLLAQSLGEKNTVASLAQKYLTLSKAWAADEVFDLRMCSLRLLYQSGGSTRQEFRAARDAWLRDPGEALRVFAMPSFRWAEAYAGAAIDAADAADALDHMPDAHPFLPLHLRNAGINEMVGRTFLLAARLAEAKTHLSFAATSCTLTNPIEQTQAMLELGNVDERLHDTDGACRHYGDVARRWPPNSAFQAGRAAQAALARLQCALPTTSHQ